MPINDTRQFTATVTGTANSQVTWTVSGAGCAGAACGTISAAGLYTAPGAVPSPATVTVTARSVADTSRTGSATVTIVLAGTPVITTLRPSSLRSGQAGGLLLRILGQNLVGGTTVVFDGAQRAADCPSLTECTLELLAADLALARIATVQMRQPDGTLSNTVNFIIVAPDLTEGVIELAPAAREADAGELAVLDPSNMGQASAVPQQMNVTSIGFAPTSSTCGGTSNKSLKIQRPGAGAVEVFICLRGAALQQVASQACCSITGPEPNDIVLSNPTQAGSDIVVTLTILSTAQLGARTIFVTSARGDMAATAGAIEILP